MGLGATGVYTLPEEDYATTPHADDYNRRLQAASAGEEQLARDLYQRNLEAARQQVAGQTNEALRNVGGVSAGASPSLLRAGTYQTEQLQQQGRGEQALEEALARQAYYAQLGDVYGRRGQYGMGAMGGAASEYGLGQQLRAADAERQAQANIAADEEAAWAVGTIAKTAGAAMGGARGFGGG